MSLIHALISLIYKLYITQSTDQYGAFWGQMFCAAQCTSQYFIMNLVFDKFKLPIGNTTVYIGKEQNQTTYTP